MSIFALEHWQYSLSGGAGAILVGKNNALAVIRWI